MAGLVCYESSDYEGNGNEAPGQDAESSRSHESVAPATTGSAGPEPDEGVRDPTTSSEAQQHELPLVIRPVFQSAFPIGPSLPPSSDAPAMDGYCQDEMPASPYSTKRTLIYNLTLPSVPDLDIPTSPPGSPPAGVSQNFEQFLALKKKGTHFNAKLEQSTALKNPNAMDKLMSFVGLDGPKQYDTTLPLDLWNPTVFPESAFVERLRKNRDEIFKEREADKSSGGRSSVDFVPATKVDGGNAPAAGGLSKAHKIKGGWM